MSYNGIDISNYQTGIDLDVVPCDFVIILVTQGTSVVNGDWERQFLQVKAKNKMIGLYHYTAGGNAANEARAFHNATAKYNGQFVHCIDWEVGSNKAWGILSYLGALYDNLHSLCGHPVVIYGPQSGYPWSITNNRKCPTWVAQYPNWTPTGYQAKPWNEGAYACDIRQYSSVGRLSGWNGNLDLDKYYGTVEQWNTWCGKEEDMPLTATDLKNIEATVWNHVLPNGAHARDCVAPACNDTFHLNDTLVPQVQSTIDKQTATITAMQAAINAMATSLGANPETIADTIKKAVTDKLNATTIQMTAK